MKYYLGIDGGGTKTKVWIINEKEETIYQETAGPSSIDTVTSDETLRQFTFALRNFGPASDVGFEFSGIFAGLGGIVTENDENTVSLLIRRLPGATDQTRIIAKNDMEIALASGLCQEGIALIAGTGMVAFGRKNDRTHKCSGWGFKEGESGSGFDLGMQAIRMMIRAYDHRLERTPFTDEVAGELKMRNVTDIIDVMNNLWGRRTEIAALAPIVTRHADLNDPHALKIVETATDEVALAVRGVYQHLKMKAPTVVIIGGLGNTKGIYRKLLIEKILAIDSGIRITAPKIDPAQAAAFLALKNS